jgi:5-oxopent-3-ene-1,2,5-tricarboxylate decarboxylase/2-hydroxyhepta-2,4-diene-1,7-dioate isomerase
MHDPTDNVTAATILPTFADAPHRYSGVVYGTLMNDPAALAALGDAVNRAPYKALPKAPVLYIKPRNTLARSGASIVVPGQEGELEIGASLGLVIGRTACRVSEAQAIEYLAGYVIVADLSVPHDSFYRPSIRFKARDGSCLIGPQMVPRASVPDADLLAMQVSIDGRVLQSASTAGMRRNIARLLADVTEFMTLRPGDILLLGVPFGAPRARAGQRFEVEMTGLGRLEGMLVEEGEGA